PWSGRCRRWTSSGGRRRLLYAASLSSVSTRGKARDGWFGGPGRECLPMSPMVSGGDRGWPGRGEIRRACANLVHCGGPGRACGVEQSVEPGGHERGVDAGGVVQRLVGCGGALLGLPLGEQGS